MQSIIAEGSRRARRVIERYQGNLGGRNILRKRRREEIERKREKENEREQNASGYEEAVIGQVPATQKDNEKWKKASLVDLLRSRRRLRPPALELKCASERFDNDRIHTLFPEDRDDKFPPNGKRESGERKPPGRTHNLFLSLSFYLSLSLSRPRPLAAPVDD